jgi:hypothetical protein
MPRQGRDTTIHENSIGRWVTWNAIFALKYILAAAGQEDYGNREVGPIHLINYVYLADLAFAERHGGETFTGTSPVVGKLEVT